MAVAYDAFSSIAIGAGDRGWTHTPSGTPRGILVWVLTGNTAGTSDIVDGVTYGGTAMVEVGTPVVKTAVERLQVHLYRLYASVPAGAQTVDVNVNTADTWLGGAISVTAGNDVETIDSDNSISSDSITDPSVTLSLGGRTCFCAIGFSSGQNAVTGIAPLSGWTSRLEDDFGGQTSGIYTYDTIGTSDVTAGWTQTAEDAGMIAIAISEVAGAASKVQTLVLLGVG